VIPPISFETVLKASGMVEAMTQKMQQPQKELLVDTKVKVKGTKP